MVGLVVGRRDGVEVTGSCVGDSVGVGVGGYAHNVIVPQGATPFHRRDTDPTAPSSADLTMMTVATVI